MRTLKVTLLGLAGSVFLAANAVAADIFVAPIEMPRQPVPAEVPAFTWAGPYVGLHIGGLWAIPPWDIPFSEPGDKSSFVHGGVLVGHLWQRGALVAGLEADVGIGRWGTLLPRQCTDPDGPPCANNEFNLFGGATAHLRGVVGVAPGQRFMLFVAGGIALAHVHAGVFSEVSGGGEIAYDEDFISVLLPGISVGVGGEIRVSDRARIRIETFYDVYRRGFDVDVSSNAIIGCCSASASWMGTVDPPRALGVRLGLILAF
jgi:outer membrane immunogenic protein